MLSLLFELSTCSTDNMQQQVLLCRLYVCEVEENENGKILLNTAHTHNRVTLK